MVCCETVNKVVWGISGLFAVVGVFLPVVTLVGTSIVLTRLLIVAVSLTW